MEYQFPFTVPEDLNTASDDELQVLLASIREHAATFTGQPASADLVAALTACRDLARNVTGIITARSEVAALSADIDTATTAPAATEPAPTTEPATGPTTDPEPVGPDPTTAAAHTRNPSVRDIIRRPGTQQLPADVDTSQYMTMHAAVDIPGRYGTGQRIEHFDDALAAIAEQIDRYPTDRSMATTGRKIRAMVEIEAERPGEAHLLEMRTFTRHSAIQFRRAYPTELRADLTENGTGYNVARRAANERFLPGGSLLKAVAAEVEAGKALTAAVGWCAPSEVIYDLCELDSQDGILALPEIQASRGGFQIPSNGGPEFATVYSGIGNAGDTHLTEAEVISETAKVCYDIPCPGFTDNRLGVDYVCLSGSMLQRRGYPEAVSWFSRRAMNALPHKINQGVIAAIVAASGGPYIVPPDPSGDDAISSLLSAVGLAIMDAKYRNRMLFNATLEVVLPYWGLEQLRAAGTRRSGVDLIGITDAQIMTWFAQRNAVPRFVYDWQDAFSGLPLAPGAGTPITSLPLTVDFLVYPAGTWVKAVQPVVSLDTVYDSTKLQTNEYTALFAEDGWATLQLCPLSRLYTAQVDPSGVTGCCPIS